MKIIRYCNAFFFFEDDAGYLCENYLLDYYTENNSHHFEINAVNEFIKNYYDYYYGLPTDYDKLFNEGQLIPEVTGLKYAIWVDPAGESRNVSHNEPRLKVIFKGGEYPLLFKKEVEFADDSHPPKQLLKELPEIKEFIHYNKRELLAFWYGHFNSFDSLKKKIAKNQVKREIVDKRIFDKLDLI